MMDLKRRAQSLCEQKDLEADEKLEVQQTVRDTEQQWRTVLQAAEETQRCREMFVASDFTEIQGADSGIWGGLRETLSCFAFNPFSNWECLY